MLTDSKLQLSSAQDLTALTAATATASTNSIDLSVARDLFPVGCLDIFAEFPTLPVSATSGATITVAVQASADASTWTTIEEFPAMTISDFTSDAYFAVRAKLPAVNTLYRYLQLSYTVSAVLTAGTITAGLTVGVPVRHAYPRNFVA